MFARRNPPQPQPVVNVAAPASAATDLLRRPFVRGGVYAWALLGFVGAAIVLSRAAAALAVVVVPLLLALFPAAVLAPAVEWLKARRVPPAAATFAVLLAAAALVAGVIAVLVPSVATQLDGLGQQIRAGFESVKRFLEQGPFGLDPIRLEELVARAREQLRATGGSGLGSGIFGAIVAVTEGIAGLLFGVVALFFYLKDGSRIAAWLRDLFPPRMRADAAEVGVRAWEAVGGYVRGQLVIAVVDATLIGIAIVILGVPLALPLTVVVFVGGLFPIIGAVVAGALAVLVALATKGVVAALILLVVIVVVQQLEGDLLAPVILGRATQLHPLATLTALTVGAVLLGVLGALLAIPIAASVTRGAGYLRHRDARHAAAT